MKGQTKGLITLIRQKQEIEIYFYQVNWAGSLSLSGNGQKENAKPFPISTSTIMLTFMMIL